MDKSLQKKLVGAAVLIALVVIFLPMLLDGEKESESLTMQIEIPEKPTYQVPNRLQQSEPGIVTGAASGAVIDPATGLVVNPAPSEAVGQPQKPAIASAAPSPQSQSVAPKPVAKIGSIRPKTETAKISIAKSATGKATPAKPATIASAGKAGDGAGFVVQVGSFSQKPNAASLKDKLASSGFPAFVQSVEINSKSIYRVKVGPRPSRDDADQLRLRLIDKANIEGIIVAHP